MMRIAFSLGLISQGHGHDDMTVEKQEKNRHNAIILHSYSRYDDSSHAHVRETLPVFYRVNGLLKL
jgi:hypothetical protein